MADEEDAPAPGPATAADIDAAILQGVQLLQQHAVEALANLLAQGRQRHVQGGHLGSQVTVKAGVERLRRLGESSPQTPCLRVHPDASRVGGSSVQVHASMIAKM